MSQLDHQHHPLDQSPDESPDPNGRTGLNSRIGRNSRNHQSVKYATSGALCRIRPVRAIDGSTR